MKLRSLNVSVIEFVVAPCFARSQLRDFQIMLRIIYTVLKIAANGKRGIAVNLTSSHMKKFV